MCNSDSSIMYRARTRCSNWRRSGLFAESNLPRQPSSSDWHGAHQLLKDAGLLMRASSGGAIHQLMGQYIFMRHLR
ncbi:hypothetical protein PGTUg99_018325 [Puccinia graminis f. sp. tritici]|uniref:Uncharacterized protein n=1 Tax=Puccinia graminis f. sp. tritici TaxID=56615 RepID=A0A5B0QQZ6_PUCGR|nr:hypothetical protein PGTUg99_018325 [Puccinia graminis f. sp. tritici]